MLFPSSWECRPGPMISEMQSQFLWSQKYSPSSVVLKCCLSFLILEMQFQFLSVPIICSVMWDPQVQELGLQFWDWISEITMFLSYLTDIPSLQLGAISMICPLDFTCILNDFRWQPLTGLCNKCRTSSSEGPLGDISVTKNCVCFVMKA